MSDKRFVCVGDLEIGERVIDVNTIDSLYIRDPDIWNARQAFNIHFIENKRYVVVVKGSETILVSEEDYNRIKKMLMEE
jgi:hypothetical protein